MGPPGRILIRLADRLGGGGGDAGGEEGGDVQLLPDGEVGQDEDGDLGVEGHPRSCASLKVLSTALIRVW